MILTVLNHSYYICAFVGLDILYEEWCQFFTLSTNRLCTLELKSFYLCIYLIRFHQIFTKLNLMFNFKQFQCKILPFIIFLILPFFFFFFAGLCCAWYGILVALPGIKPGPSAVKVQCSNHWTAREFPYFAFLMHGFE